MGRQVLTPEIKCSTEIKDTTPHGQPFYNASRQNHHSTEKQVKTESGKNRG